MVELASLSRLATLVSVEGKHGGVGYEDGNTKGIRTCPGQHLTIASIWIVIAIMLATIEFSKTKDEDGNEITPVIKMTTGLPWYVIRQNGIAEK